MFANWFSARKAILGTIAIFSALLMTILGMVGNVSAQQEFPKLFEVNVNSNEIKGYNFTPGNTITLQIDDPDTSTSPDYQTSATYPPDNSGPVVFALGQGFTLHSGFIIQMSDGVTTKLMTFWSMAVTQVDTSTNTISGTAGPGKYIRVLVTLPSGESGWDFVPADALGNWQTTWFYSPIPDIQNGTLIKLNYADEDLDSIVYAYDQPILPRIEANPRYGSITTFGWGYGALVTLKIDDPTTGSNPDCSASQTSTWGDSVYFSTYQGCPFKVGDVITVEGSNVSASSTVAWLNVTTKDVINDVIAGVADPDEEIVLKMHIGGYWPGIDIDLTTMSDASGNWSFDFSKLSPPVDLLLDNSGGSVQVFDNAGNSTVRLFYLYKTTVRVHNRTGVVTGSYFQPNELVTLRIDDPSTGTVPDYEAAKNYPDDDGDGPGVRTVGFNVPLNLVKVGNVIQMEGSISTVQFTIWDLSIISADPQNDIVFGKGFPDAPGEIIVKPLSGPYRYYYSLRPDAEGDLAMDFGNMPGEAPLDIQGGVLITLLQSVDGNVLYYANWQVPLNSPPIADAGGPYTSYVGEVIPLDASNSHNPEGTPLTFEWDLDYDGKYDDATGLTADFPYTSAGSYTVGLRVTATNGLGNIDTAEITINEIPPSNNNFADAMVIPSSPYDGMLSTTGASLEAGEPTPSCAWFGSVWKTVWVAFTPPASGVIVASIPWADFTPVFAVYTGNTVSSLTQVGCQIDTGNQLTFHADAGTTYYFQIGNPLGNQGGSVQFHLDEILPPPNDDLANATVIPSPLPYDVSLELNAATSLEAGEPTPSCAWYGNSRTVWVAFTPATSGSVSASIPSYAFSPVFAAYTGNSLTNLSEVGCQNYYTGNLMTFHADAGTTYYFQLGKLTSWDPDGWMQFHLEVTPPPAVGFSFTPSDPSAFDTIQFYDQSYDPVNIGIQSFAWDFGDGATATGGYPTYKYAKDGDYAVQLSVTTFDGRTASISQVVQVKTHDVAIIKITAPQTARAGQTQKITVEVKSNRYSEYVMVDFYKSVPGGFERVDTLILRVPVSSGNKTTLFTFSYTFTKIDSGYGKMSFKAVATIVDARDMLPADNVLISSPPTRIIR